MDQLPPDFAESLARVLEPGDESAAAEVIQAASLLDDDGLRIFLERFAARVRSSPAPVRREELMRFLRIAKSEGGL
jgi:hypothetical protein